MTADFNMTDFLDAVDNTAPSAASADTTNPVDTSTVTPSTTPSELKYYSTASVRFSGRNDLFRLPDFLVTVEAQIYARNLQSDVDRISFFGRSLTGPAAQWFVNWIRTHDQHQFDQFLIDFKNKFIGMIDPHAIFNAFQQLKEANVGIDLYNQKFSQLLALMPANIWTTKGELLFYYRGLTPDTARMVALARPTTIEAAMEAASETVSITNRAFPSFTNYDMDGDIRMAAALDPVYLDDSSRSNSHVAAIQPSRGRRRRYNNPRPSYKKHPQMKRPSRQECMDKGLCFRCFKASHRYSECPDRKASNPQ